jgi:hypothetical protein
MIQGGFVVFQDRSDQSDQSDQPDHPKAPVRLPRLLHPRPPSLARAQSGRGVPAACRHLRPLALRMSAMRLRGGATPSRRAGLWFAHRGPCRWGPRSPRANGLRSRTRTRTRSRSRILFFVYVYAYRFAVYGYVNRFAVNVNDAPEVDAASPPRFAPPFPP